MEQRLAANISSSGGRRVLREMALLAFGGDGAGAVAAGSGGFGQMGAKEDWNVAAAAGLVIRP